MLTMRCSSCHIHLPFSSYDTKKTGEYFKTCRACLTSKVLAYNKARKAPVRDLNSVRKDLLDLILSINDPATLGQLLSFALSTIPHRPQSSKEVLFPLKGNATQHI